MPHKPKPKSRRVSPPPGLFIHEDTPESVKSIQEMVDNLQAQVKLLARAVKEKSMQFAERVEQLEHIFVFVDIDQLNRAIKEVFEHVLKMISRMLTRMCRIARKLACHLGAPVVVSLTMFGLCWKAWHASPLSPHRLLWSSALHRGATRMMASPCCRDAWVTKWLLPI